MQVAARAADEARRLQSLVSLYLLDTQPEERFDRITRLACKVFHVPIALISLIDSERQWFKSRQGITLQQVSRDESLCAHTILGEGAMLVPDTLADPRFADNPLVTCNPHVRFYAGHPIHSPDGARVGTLSIIDRRPRELSVDDLGMFADLAAMIDREFFLIEQATTDELTHLSNRRGFATVGAHVLALCRRGRQPAAVVAFDLDNFKHINDTQGHEAGDHVLRQFAKMLFTHFRASDIVARLGGDEFAVLCGGTSATQLSATLDRLQGQTASSMLARAYPELSWSAGVADFNPESADSIGDILRVADARMYAEKERRRPR